MSDDELHQTCESSYARSTAATAVRVDCRRAPRTAPPDYGARAPHCGIWNESGVKDDTIERCADVWRRPVTVGRVRDGLRRESRRLRASVSCAKCTSLRDELGPPKRTSDKSQANAVTHRESRCAGRGIAEVSRPEKRARRKAQVARARSAHQYARSPDRSPAEIEAASRQDRAAHGTLSLLRRVATGGQLSSRKFLHVRRQPVALQSPSRLSVRVPATLGSFVPRARTPRPGELARSSR